MRAIITFLYIIVALVGNSTFAFSTPNTNDDYFLYPAPITGNEKQSGTNGGVVAFYQTIGATWATTTVESNSATNNNKNKQYYFWGIDTAEGTSTYTVEYDVNVRAGNCAITNVTYWTGGVNTYTDSYFYVGDDIAGSVTANWTTSTTTKQTLTYTGTAGSNRYGFGYAIKPHNTGVAVECDGDFRVYAVKKDGIPMYTHYASTSLNAGGGSGTTSTTTVNIDLPDNAVEFLTLSVMVFVFFFIATSSAFLLIYIYRIIHK